MMLYVKLFENIIKFKLIFGMMMLHLGLGGERGRRHAHFPGDTVGDQGTFPGSQHVI